MEATFEYHFPAIRGVQAGREYYVSMCPLRVIPKIFLFNEEEVVPELRAQRVLNKAVARLVPPGLVRETLHVAKEFVWCRTCISLYSPVCIILCIIGGIIIALDAFGSDCTGLGKILVFIGFCWLMVTMLMAAFYLYKFGIKQPEKFTTQDDLKEFRAKVTGNVMIKIYGVVSIIVIIVMTCLYLFTKKAYPCRGGGGWSLLAVSLTFVWALVWLGVGIDLKGRMDDRVLALCPPEAPPSYASAIAGRFEMGAKALGFRKDKK